MARNPGWIGPVPSLRSAFAGTPARRSLQAWKDWLRVAQSRTAESLERSGHKRVAGVSPRLLRIGLQWKLALQIRLARKKQRILNGGFVGSQPGPSWSHLGRWFYERKPCYSIMVGVACFSRQEIWAALIMLASGCGFPSTIVR